MIHTSAVISEKAVLGKNVMVMPFSDICIEVLEDSVSFTCFCGYYCS